MHYFRYSLHNITLNKQSELSRLKIVDIVLSEKPLVTRFDFVYFLANSYSFLVKIKRIGIPRLTSFFMWYWYYFPRYFPNGWGDNLSSRNRVSRSWYQEILLPKEKSQKRQNCAIYCLVCWIRCSWDILIPSRDDNTTIVLYNV